MLLDPECVGRISFVPFHKAARSMGFGDTRFLWSAIDVDRSGFITLDEWDTRTFRHLAEFRDICFREYGGVEHAFVHGMDHTGSRTVTLPELQRFCDEVHFSGDVKTLMLALDVKMTGFITEDELAILHACMGEKFGKPKLRKAGVKLAANALSPRAGERAPDLQIDFKLPELAQTWSKDLSLF